MPDTRLGALVRWLAAGYLLLGVAHIALLPPWEGFDEFAHYSYIQELADTGALPRLATARLSTDVEAYRAAAPLPYGSRPPFEDNGGLTYRTFHEGGAAVAARGRALVHERPAQPRRYAPTAIGNWQAQHPPLYYAALAPLYRLTRGLSWGAHLFVLRLASFLLAWTAWVAAVGLCLAAAHRREDAFPWSWAALGTALWPMAWPAWFPEFARLGNDSLAALLATAVWAVMVQATRAGLTTRRAVTLGVLLGAGLLTKLPFVALAGAVAAFWLVRAARGGGESPGAAVPRVALMLGLALVIGGWWYLQGGHAYLVALWPDEIEALRARGGIAGGLAARFSLAAWLRAQVVIVATFAWAGTWSLALPPYPILAPLALAVVLALGGYLAALRRYRPGELAWAPFAMALVLAAGLEYHALVRIALTGQAITPGYYLHILMAPLGVALGLALERAFPRPAGRAATALLGVYALLFALGVSAAQVWMFAGQLHKSGTDRFYQSVPGAALFDLALLARRLSALTYPALGAAAFGAGAVLVAAGALTAWTIARAAAPGARRT